MDYTVTDKAMRPASPERRCFYCRKRVGENHTPDCVLIQKKVVIRATVEFEAEVPAHWASDNIEFQRNEGTWCVNNFIQELENLSIQNGCLCGTGIHFQHVRDVPNSTELDE